MNNKLMLPKTSNAINSLAWNWKVSKPQGVGIQQNHLGSFWEMQTLEPHPD